MTANAKFGMEIIRNAPTVDTLSALEFALEADHSAHGRAITRAMSWARITQRQRSGEPFDDQVAHGRLPVFAELDAEVTA